MFSSYEEVLEAKEEIIFGQVPFGSSTKQIADIALLEV